MAREVDRLLAGLTTLGARPDAGPADDQRPRSSAPRATPAPARRAPRASRRSDALTRQDLVALWARVLLSAALGVMITQWPYVHACGMPLVQYLGAVTMVMVAGAWIAVSTWTRRHVAGHILALLLLLWGIALAAYEVLPRVGYAAQRWHWQC
jgi:hypothetical protein